MDLPNSSNEASSVVDCRAGGVAEYPVVAQLRQEMGIEWDEDYDAMSPGWREKFAAYFAARQEAGMAQLFLAYDDDAPVGCVIVSIAEHYRRYVFGTETGYVNAVYVRPAYRRRGIARELMQAAINWCRERGCTGVRLRTSDEGRVLYEALGFRAGREMQLDL